MVVLERHGFHFRSIRPCVQNDRYVLQGHVLPVSRVVVSSDVCICTAGTETRVLWNYFFKIIMIHNSGSLRMSYIYIYIYKEARHRVSDAPTRLELIFVQNSNDFRVLPFRFSLVRQWRGKKKYMGNEGTHAKKKKKKIDGVSNKKQTTTMGQRIGLVTV